VVGYEKDVGGIAVEVDEADAGGMGFY